MDSKKRVYQVSFDIEATEDFDDNAFAQKLEKLINMLGDGIYVRGWNCEHSWNLNDYDQGINQFNTH